MRPRAEPHRDSKPTGAKPPGKSPLFPTPSNLHPINHVLASACGIPGDTRIPEIMLTLPDEPAAGPKKALIKPKILSASVKNATLGADLQKSRKSPSPKMSPPPPITRIAGPFLLANIPEDKMVPPDREVFMFKTRIKDQWAHALADTGASENFMSHALAKYLNLELHQRKRVLRLLLANGEYVECTHFVRANVNIGTFSARMAFAITQTGIHLVLGMPFHYRFEPIPRWRARKFVIYYQNRVHTLEAAPLHRVLSANPNLPTSIAQTAANTSTIISSIAKEIGGDVVMELPLTAQSEVKYDELTEAEKRAIQNSTKDENTRTFHGKPIPKPSPIAE